MLDQYQQEFIELVRKNSGRYQKHEIFRDFCELAALTISNSVDRTQYDAREARYLEIVGRYQRKEVDRFPAMLACVTASLESDFKDCLGEIFMAMELGDNWKGQFFTPYSVARAMGQMVFSDVAPIIKEKGYVTMQEPASGGGAMVIAAAQAVKEEGFNYQKRMHVTAIDIDRTACHMSYIQFSLLHIPAIVLHGNSLTNVKWEHFVTPAHVIGLWGSRLYRAEAEKQKTEQPGRDANTPEPEKHTPEIMAEQHATITAKREQLSLF